MLHFHEFFCCVNFHDPNSNDITVGLIRRQWKLHNSWWLHYQSLLVMQCDLALVAEKVIKNHLCASRTRGFLDYFFWPLVLDHITFHS